jgi:hypothetical protein
MKRIVLLTLVLAACGDTSSSEIEQLNLDRPIDVSFSCFGGLRITDPAVDPQKQVVISSYPLAGCDIRSQPHTSDQPVPIPPGQEDPLDDMGKPIKVGASQYYAFILQSEPGTVALASFATKAPTLFGGRDVTVLDTDPLTPGQNGLSVGEGPVAIGPDATGCYQITANAGSCDMSVIDATKAIGAERATVTDAVTRTNVTNAAGVVMDARPAAMAMQPQTTVLGTNFGTSMDPLACPATPQGLVYVAYPSCHLVAAVDLATSKIVGGVQYDAAGVASILPDGNVTCPSECAMNEAATPGPRPVTLDLEVDEDHASRVLVIGSDNSPALTVVQLDPDAFKPLSLSQIALENTTGKLGVTNLAVSPVIGMGGSMGVINDDDAPGGQFQFAYAVATDGTVRVADILQVRRECDTQVDPRFIHDFKIIPKLSCFPVGDPATPARRAGARGPGIELVGDTVPTSVDIFRVDPVPNDIRATGLPSKLIGYYAVISSTSGINYIANVDNDDYPDFVSNTDPIRTQIPLTIAHQLRDAIIDRGAVAEKTIDDPNSPGKSIQVPTCTINEPATDNATGTVRGGARVAAPPVKNVPVGTVAAEKVFQLPTLHNVLCMGYMDEKAPVSELSFSAPVAQRDLAFPDLRALRSDETWTLSWEGSLSQDTSDVAIDGPPVRDGQMFAEAGGIRLEDQTKPFCAAGVEPFDVVQFRGCDPSRGDADCALGYTCYVHPSSQIPGLGACMLTDEADRLANACKSFLTSIRRYTVGNTTAGTLGLLPRKVVLRTTPLDGCVDDAQCSALATYAAQNVSGANPIDDMTAADTHTWRCEVDPLRKPVPGTGKRCIEACDTDADCFAGRVCQGVNPSVAKSGTCMEGVVPPQSCINAAQRYEIRAGEAFTVIGTKSGYVHPIIADAAGKCIRDPKESPFKIGRIPLVAPACDPAADLRTGKKPDGTFDANPCTVTLDQSEYQPNYVPGTCTLDATTPTTLASRTTTAIRFRNRGMLFNIVDPAYPGDTMCLYDRKGTLGNVPLVFPGFQIQFRQNAGFAPLTLGIPTSFPIKVVRGPLESIWVVDEGDFLSGSLSTPSTRGKVYRVESQALGITNLIQ